MQQQTQTTPLQDASDDWLSALLDGELPEQEGDALLRRLTRDADYVARWSEYCLIGDALRGTACPPDRLNQRIHAALAQEPTVLAPVPKRAKAQPVLWLAAAATVAAVTWMVLSAAPDQGAPVEIAAGPANVNVLPYLAAHQDYAQALTSGAEMHFSRVALTAPEADR